VPYETADLMTQSILVNGLGHITVDRGPMRDDENEIVDVSWRKEREV
jgi:hypothetical protein